MPDDFGGVDPERLRRAGVFVPDEPSELARHYQSEQDKKDAARGEPHGLTIAEVRAADEAGMPLSKYAGLRGVRTLEEYRRLRRREREAGDEAA
jgi:hypothetical protein